MSMKAFEFLRDLTVPGHLASISALYSSVIGKYEILNQKDGSPTKRLVASGGRVHLTDGETAGGDDVLPQRRGQVDLHELVVVIRPRSLTPLDLPPRYGLPDPAELQTGEKSLQTGLTVGLLHPAESLVSYQVGQNIKVLVAGVTEVDIHTLGQVGVARVVALAGHQLLLHPHIAQLRLTLGSLGDSRVLEVFLVVVLVLGSEGHEKLLGGPVEQRPGAVPVIHNLEVLDAAGEGDELPAELQEVEAVVEGVAELAKQCTITHIVHIFNIYNHSSI